MLILNFSCLGLFVGWLCGFLFVCLCFFLVVVVAGGFLCFETHKSNPLS